MRSTFNRREQQARSVQYVSREMVGYEDLDDFGVWRPVPEYGVVWFPSSVPLGWAPYRFGHWIWVEPWGWTWVDDMPWGFAPFHYGRWAFVQGAWVWVPSSEPAGWVPYRFGHWTWVEPWGWTWVDDMRWASHRSTMGWYTRRLSWHLSVETAGRRLFR